MRSSDVILRQLFCALIAIALSHAGASAKGGNFHTEDRYNPQHIESLPAEIRNAISRKCSSPRALHPFARYSNDSGQIVLHFEHFSCGSEGSYCTSSGCLHQVYVAVGGHYRLVRSYYAPPGD
jgi:hypothetical protein